MFKIHNILPWIRRQPRWRIGVLAALVVLALILFNRGTKIASSGPAFAVRRGPLEISVVAGGSVQALESQQIKCEVKVGYQGLKILKIVEEGFQVTEEDIRTNKVLVELDSSDLQKQKTQQEIALQSAAAALVDAQQAYEIQVNQNLSDIKAAEQKTRFARLDFEKFLGVGASREILAQLGLDTPGDDTVTNGLPVSMRVNPPERSSEKTPAINLAKSTAPSPSELATLAGLDLGGGVQTQVSAPEEQPEPEPVESAEKKSVDLPQATSVPLDFSRYAKLEMLGDGEAKQKIRKLEDDLQVARKEVEQAKATLEGTSRLFAKGFVTKTDLQKDEIAYENSRLKVQTAETARELFLRYDFPKSAEEFLSKYLEAMRELERARKAAVSKLAQAKAKLKSAEGQYEIQLRQRNELLDQIAKCVMTAQKPGLVVYGSGGEEMFYYGGQEPIREGATVRERQSIITIPDLNKMGVKVRIHESSIKKIKKGQKARIKVDAFSDKKVEGEITHVGVVPDSQNRWMNPDLKVYLTTIAIEGVHDWLKPGMSAKVEIVVDQLADVTYVPMQAVAPWEGKQVCYVLSGGKAERREVDVGQYNDAFIEIKNGIKKGQKVLLRAPVESESEPSSGRQTKTRSEEEKPETPAIENSVLSSPIKRDE